MLFSMKISRLKRRLSGDHDFKGHTILGSMCTEPHPLAKRTYKRFLSTNVGDPGLFPNLISLEREYISQIGKMLSLKNPYGNVVSGGSEANILAMWSARNLAKENQREVIISRNYHFSFEKAADMLGLTLIPVDLDENQRVKPDLVESSITENTMAIVGIAGTTGLGVCDPIDRLSDIAVKHGLFLHVDAAFGGFVFPFMENGPIFDFKLPGVQSITIDPHKMGRAVIQSGCILYRTEKIASAVHVPVSYLSGGNTVNNLVMGTRSGASIAAAWMIFNYLGYKGYKKIVDQVMDLTHWFVSEIRDIDGLDVKVGPSCNVVGITSENIPVKSLLPVLREKGWALSEWPDYMRVVIMPHVSKRALKKFLKSLKITLSELS